MKDGKALSNRRFLLKCVVVIVLLIAFTSFFYGSSVFAAKCGGADTALLDCNDDEGGIWHILSLILDIFSIGVGILGVVGISVAGIQYLSAGEKEEQTRKAKNRIFQIVIGLVLYALVFVGLEWLMPGGIVDSNSPLAKIGSTTQIEEQEAKREAEREKRRQSSADDDDDDDDDDSDSSPSSKPSVSEMTNEEIHNQLSKVARKFTTKSVRNTNRDKDFNEYKKKGKLNAYQTALVETGVSDLGGTGKGWCRKIGRMCSAFVATVVRSVITDSTGKNFPAFTTKIPDYITKVNKKHPGTWKRIGVNAKKKPGDIFVEFGPNGGHTGIFIQRGDKVKVAEANVGTYTATTCNGGFWPKKTGYTNVPYQKSHPDVRIYRYMGGK